MVMLSTWGSLQGTKSLLSLTLLSVTYASDLTPSHNMVAMALGITTAFQEKSKSQKPFREASAFYRRRKTSEISAYIYFIDQLEKQKSSKVKEKGLLLK